MRNRTCLPGHRRLFAEFAEYYLAQRCRWAPRTPDRVFFLAYKVVYPQYRRRMTRAEFLGVVYDTLGFRGAARKGLFQTFDLKEYKGALSAEDHFVNFFKQKLLGNLDLATRRTTDSGRPGDPNQFPHRPELGLVHESPPTPTDDIDQDDLIGVLSDRERDVIRLMYWGGLSARRVGLELGIDHKTVTAAHHEALFCLRRVYGLMA